MMFCDWWTKEGERACWRIADTDCAGRIVCRFHAEILRHSISRVGRKVTSKPQAGVSRGPHG